MRFGRQRVLDIKPIVRDRLVRVVPPPHTQGQFSPSAALEIQCAQPVVTLRKADRAGPGTRRVIPIMIDDNLFIYKKLRSII